MTRDVARAFCGTALLAWAFTQACQSAPPTSDDEPSDDTVEVEGGSGAGGSGDVAGTGGTGAQGGQSGAPVAGTGGNTAGAGGAGGQMAGAGGRGGQGGSGGAGGSAGNGGAGGGGAGGSQPTAMVDTRPIVSASVSGFQLMVRRKNADGSTSAPAPFDMRGIAWSPASKGGQGGAFAQWTATDLPLMRAANINTIRTYGPVSREVLDECLKHGIVAVITVLMRAGEDVTGRVNAVKDHPAVLMWLVGNEWNYNKLYGSCNGGDCYGVVNAAARTIKQLDPNHPVATSFAPTQEIPTESDLRALDAVDIWGLNIYSQPGFFGRFSNYKALAERTGIRKPIFISEYGTDAFHSGMQRVDEAMQAMGLRVQTTEIRAQLSAKNASSPCIGGTPFEWNDEWWKSGNPGGQDSGGFPNIGVYGDQYANEEWWGVVDIDRRPRAAYKVLQELYAR